MKKIYSLIMDSTKNPLSNIPTQTHDDVAGSGVDVVYRVLVVGGIDCRVRR